MNSLLLSLLGGVITYFGLRFALPFLPRAGVNERSAHAVATPQGAGIVIFAALALCSLNPLAGVAMFARNSQYGVLLDFAAVHV